MRSTALVLFSIGVAFVAAGQDPSGKISGVVTDALGGVADATVQAKDTATGKVFKAVASQKGAYSLSSLPPGAYDISVNVGGLKPFQRKGVAVAAAKLTQLDIQLEDTTQLSTLGEDRLNVAAAEKRHHAPSGPTPRTPEGKPDFSGVWWSPVVTDPGKPEFLPWAEDLMKKRQANNLQESPQARCQPSPVTRVGPLLQLVQSKDYLIDIEDDATPGFRQIYLDRRAHPKDPNPSWQGHAIGRWEGDTLIIDRVGFNDRAWLDRDGHPHTDKLHVIERYRRPDLGHLEAEVTVEDPGVLAKPWTFKRVAELAPSEEIYEFVCTENNVDVPHMVGK
ncbi:MAG: carboxypeptidase regulatory-like domain-containing protein [Bryobacterales bacterium]|nr:carboxypeptidase regulatory-like domain-containing protein [Bryobacterales bacterium]